MSQTTARAAASLPPPSNCTVDDDCYRKWSNVIPEVSTVEPVALGVILGVLALLLQLVSVLFLYFFSGWRALRKGGGRPRRDSFVDQENYPKGTYEDSFQHKPAVPCLGPASASASASASSAPPQRQYVLSTSTSDKHEK